MGEVNKGTRWAKYAPNKGSQVSVTGTELGITTHQWNIGTSSVQGVYFDSIRVI